MDDRVYARDKRFAHPAWAANPVYRRLVQAYLVETQALLDTVDEVELDAKSRARARFAMTLLTHAAAPTNTLLGNPSALAKAVETRGQSLRTGARHLLHDLRTNGGMPSTVDTRPFTVGENLATTPGEVVHRTEVFELIQYAPRGTKVYSRPLVAIPRRSTSTTSRTWRPVAASSRARSPPTWLRATKKSNPSTAAGSPAADAGGVAAGRSSAQSRFSPAARSAGLIGLVR